MSAEPYEKQYRESIEHPTAFWHAQAQAIDWFSPPENSQAALLDASEPPFYRWFPDATCNMCVNAVDRHVLAGHGDRVAFYYESPITESRRSITYAELLADVARMAGVLVAQGVTKGDRVIIYMPMIPDVAVAMLACARIGAVHSVVFGGFAPKELSTRIAHAGATVVVTASCGVEPNRTIPYVPIVTAALQLTGDTNTVQTVIVKQREGQVTASAADLSALQAVCGAVLDMDSAIAAAKPADAVAVESTHPLYVLYTSGTTGEPKGVVRDTGGHMVALKWTMSAVFGLEPGDVMFTASDVGWVVGHSYIVYAPLLHGCSSVLFEGKPVGTPDAGVFWRTIAHYKVKTFFTAPTAFRALKRADPEGEFARGADLSSFQYLFLAGERSDTDTIKWAEAITKVPVIDHWWQTETGWPMVANFAGLGLLPIKYGSPSRAVPGWDVRILDADGAELPPDSMGEIVVKLPLPPGALLTLWKADQRYIDTYTSHFPGYYRSGDAGYMDSDGYLYVMARTDDVINVAGHRLSTGALEEVLGSHPKIAESAVVGMDDALKGQLPCAFVCLKLGQSADNIAKECVAAVREQIGAVAALKTVIVVERLPKTRSGKILRGVMAKMASGKSYNVPPTIDDPQILEEIHAQLVAHGIITE